MSTHAKRWGATRHHSTAETTPAIPLEIATRAARTCAASVTAWEGKCGAPLCGSKLQVGDTTRGRVLRTYLPAIVFVCLGGLVGALFVTAGSLLGPKPKTPTTYQGDRCESGMPAEGGQGCRFGISFYLIAMLFILFDIEVVFLYPIAVQLREFGTFALIETGVFIVLLVVAFVYVWRRGALEWR